MFLSLSALCSYLTRSSRLLLKGTFGQQAQQIILTERVVRVHRSVLGGTGPLINAGFPLPGSPPDPFTLCYSKEEEDAPEPEGSEYVKELLIDGLGRSGWGDFKCTGRVRAWDGLVTFVKEYVVSYFLFHRAGREGDGRAWRARRGRNAFRNSTQKLNCSDFFSGGLKQTRDALGNEPAMRGKWVYRGYLKQDSRFVGNWRDCFTDVQFRGSFPARASFTFAFPILTQILVCFSVSQATKAPFTCVANPSASSSPSPLLHTPSTLPSLTPPPPLSAPRRQSTPTLAPPSFPTPSPPPPLPLNQPPWSSPLPSLSIRRLTVLSPTRFTRLHSRSCTTRASRRNSARA